MTETKNKNKGAFPNHISSYYQGLTKLEFVKMELMKSLIQIRKNEVNSSDVNNLDYMATQLAEKILNPEE